MSAEAGRDRLYIGEFIVEEDRGLEVVISNGWSWVMLEWNDRRSALEILTVNNNYVPDRNGGAAAIDPALDREWELKPGQNVVKGHFLPIPEDTLLVTNGEKLAIASFIRDEGFQSELMVTGNAGSWILSTGDSFEARNLDEDPADEAVVRNGNRIGVLHFSPGLTSTQVSQLDLERLELEPVPRFRRGDANDDGEVDISDVVMTLGYLFLGFRDLRCEDAADVDDSGVINVSDAQYLLMYLFNKGDPPHPPTLPSGGFDTTPDSLRCDPEK
jgi:hypothetical protein